MLCSEILVRYGMDVNAMDHNNNTALDYLAWELGQKWYQISKGSSARCLFNSFNGILFKLAVTALLCIVHGQPDKVVLLATDLQFTTDYLWPGSYSL